MEPIIYGLANAGQNWMVVCYEAGAVPAAVREGVEGVWKRFASDAPIRAEFSKDVVADLYKAEEICAQAFAGFALLASSSPASACSASPPSPPSAASRRSASARCWERGAATSSG